MCFWDVMHRGYYQIHGWGDQLLTNNSEDYIKSTVILENNEKKMKQVRKIDSGDTPSPPKLFLWCLMRWYFAIYAPGASPTPSELGAQAFLSPTPSPNHSKTTNMLENHQICFKNHQKCSKNMFLIFIIVWLYCIQTGSSALRND